MAQAEVNAITINTPNQLRPFDMVSEGIFIRELSWSPWDWVIAPLCYDEQDINGLVLKSPVWGEPIERKMVFPLIVIRGRYRLRVGDARTKPAPALLRPLPTREPRSRQPG